MTVDPQEGHSGECRALFSFLKAIMDLILKIERVRREGLR